MPEKTLPIYQIPDFETEKISSSEFYYSKLDLHLQKHLFIQKPHKHDFYILLLISAGTGTHTIDFKYYPVKPGSVFFLSPGQVHSWQLSTDTNGHILFFKGSFYSALFTQRKLMSFSFFHSNHAVPVMEIESDKVKELTFYFERIDQEITDPGWSSITQLASYTDLLLTNCYRYYLEKNLNSSASTMQLDLFQKIEVLIDSNFLENREVSFYAEQMNMSIKQLNSVTKKAVGKPISQLILERVILESKRLLINSSLTISEISSHFNLDDPSYFSRLFKRKTSFTPEEFRKSVQSE